MNKRKHIAPILILISIFLLIGFNAFWLKKSYEEQKDVLQKEIDNSLEKSYSELQDSLIQKQLASVIKPKIEKTIKQNKPKPKPQNLNIKAAPESFIRMTFDTTKKNTGLWKDSSKGRVVQIFLSKTTNINDSSSKKFVSRVLSNINQLPVVEQVSITVDSNSKKNLDKQLKLHGIFSSAQISSLTINTSKDSNKKVQQEIFKKLPPLPKPKPTQADIVINLNMINLDAKTLEAKMNAKLAKAKVPLKYRVIKADSNFVEPQKAIYSEYPSNKLREKKFIAINEEYRYYLIKKILPEILFSFLLIALTSLSFGIIYQNLKRQEKLAILKNDFISNVTHELKTPITTVGVAIEALNNFNVLQNPDKTKEYLEISKNELARLSMMVDKVLKTAIFEQKEIELKFEKNDLKQIVQKVLSTMKLQFEKYNAQIEFDYKGDDFMIESDIIHLTNVVYNLIENALKYSKNPQINLNLTDEPDKICLTVKDNGLGIPKEYQNKIFDKFFRVPQGDVHDIKGYGLGLSYVKSVVEKHNGTITVESELNQGSIFKITLYKV